MPSPAALSKTVSWQLPFGVYLLALPLGALTFLPVPEPAVATSDRESNGGPGNSKSGIGGVVNAFRGTPLLIFVCGLYFAANALYAIVVYYLQLLAGFGVTSALVINLYLSVLGIAGGLSACFTVASSVALLTASSPSSRSTSG